MRRWPTTTRSPGSANVVGVETWGSSTDPTAAFRGVPSDALTYPASARSTVGTTSTSGKYPANFENSLDDRCSPQDDAEPAITFKGVLPRLHEYADSRGVDELGR